MEFQLTTELLLTSKVDGIILPLMKDQKHPSYLRDVDQALDGELSARMKDTHFKGDVGQVLVFNTAGKIAAKAVYVTGMGTAEDFTSHHLRKAYAAAVRKAQNEFARTLSILYLENEIVDDFFRCSLEGMMLGAYSFDEYRSAVPSKEDKKEIRTVKVHHLDKKLATEIKRQVARATAIADSTNLARDLINRPACDMYPEVLVKVCREHFKGKPYTLKIMDEAEIKRRKMMAFFSVANGSPKPPRFIHIHYKPAGKPKKKIALVGKGVTFDTGGLSLKPPRFMVDMKDDMSGAAAVIGTLKALTEMRPNVEVHGIIAATENIIGGESTRPGDVVYASNGKSIEVLNTDAEGRLTLADALGYACALGVDEVIDLATLTGACVIAVGDLMAAAMTNDDAMYARLKRAADSAGEKIWQLPLEPDYKDYIKGDIADLKNMGPDGGAAGTILGGLFLQEFVTCKSWVHLDIAGPAFNNRDLTIAPKGGAGFGVRTLINYLDMV